MTTRLTPICIADGPTLTGDTPASCLPLSCPLTLPAGYWTVGKAIRLRMSGKLSTKITNARGDFDELPGVARFDFRLGGIVVWDSLGVLLDPISRATDLPWTLNVEITCRAAGVESTTFLGTGVFSCAAITGAGTQPSAGASVVVPWSTAPAGGAAVNAFIALPVDVFFTQTSARGSLTVSQYAIEEI
jgi:hypothetical protein